MRYKTPLHQAWHRRVEGQIHDAMHQHPEWFTADTKKHKAIARSVAKRIVGEIVAVASLAMVPAADGSGTGADGGTCACSYRGRRRPGGVIQCRPAGFHPR